MESKYNSNYEIIKEIRQLTPIIKDQTKYLYGTKKDVIPAFFQDPDQDYTRNNRNEVYGRLVDKLNKQIEKKRILTNYLKDTKLARSISSRNVSMFNRKLPGNVLQYIGSFITGDYKNTANTLRSSGLTRPPPAPAKNPAKSSLKTPGRAKGSRRKSTRRGKGTRRG